MRRIFATVITGSGVLVGAAAFLMGLSVAYDVVVRTLFGATTVWVVDVNAYLMGFITFLGAGYALREDGHVGVDIVVRRLSPRAQWAFRVISDLVVLVVTLVLLWLATEFWWSAWASGERSWGLFTVELWIPYASFPLGMFLLLAVQIRRMLTAWR